jgi:putative membrane protein insertion efficiency factor
LTAAIGKGPQLAPGHGARPRGACLATGFVRLYQLTLSGFIGNSCRHLPSCSEYAYEAIARHGLWKGGWLAFFRVGRCGPGGTHGIDNVPETLGSRLVPGGRRGGLPMRPVPGTGSCGSAKPHLV